MVDAANSVGEVIVNDAAPVVSVKRIDVVSTVVVPVAYTAALPERVITRTCLKVQATSFSVVFASERPLLYSAWRVIVMSSPNGTVEELPAVSACGSMELVTWTSVALYAPVMVMAAVSATLVWMSSS